MNSENFRFVVTEARVLIAMVMKTIVRASAERLSASGANINGIQLGVLRILRAHPHTSSELAKMFVLDPSTLVPIIDDLEEKGYLQRTKDPADRRRTPLVLTERGHELIQTIEDVQEPDAFFQAFSALGEEKTLSLLELLRELMTNMPDGETMLCDAQAQVYQRAPEALKQAMMPIPRGYIVE
jgi:DNA-binding MarR family transcriptional regulator